MLSVRLVLTQQWTSDEGESEGQSGGGRSDSAIRVGVFVECSTSSAPRDFSPSPNASAGQDHC